MRKTVKTSIHIACPFDLHGNRGAEIITRKSKFTLSFFFFFFGGRKSKRYDSLVQADNNDAGFVSNPSDKAFGSFVSRIYYYFSNVHFLRVFLYQDNSRLFFFVFYARMEIRKVITRRIHNFCIEKRKTIYLVYFSFFSQIIIVIKIFFSQLFEYHLFQ